MTVNRELLSSFVNDLSIIKYVPWTYIATVEMRKCINSK